jgi:CheY-like chemotaxis protein
MTARQLLVIDDEADFMEFVRLVAEELGFTVTKATRAQDFQAAYDRGCPDVIVLDIVMPEVDGIELIQWLMSRDCKSRVIVVTGFSPDYGHAAALLGATRGLEVVTLGKPVKLADLRRALMMEERKIV